MLRKHIYASNGNTDFQSILYILHEYSRSEKKWSLFLVIVAMSGKGSHSNIGKTYLGGDQNLSNRIRHTNNGTHTEKKNSPQKKIFSLSRLVPKKSLCVFPNFYIIDSQIFFCFLSTKAFFLINFGLEKYLLREIYELCITTGPFVLQICYI